MVNDPRIIVSLDFPAIAPAMELADKLDPAHCRVKVGKELFTRSGPVVVEELLRREFSVFLDLKFHDIPNTVGQACLAAAGMGVWMVNIHAAGGSKMIRAAREAIDQCRHKPLLVAVTVLTSMSAADLAETGIEGALRDHVLKLAGLAAEAGADGVVCSAEEAAFLRDTAGPSFCLVTPGIRPAGFAGNDQQRVATPASAIAAGSDYLVIGRPIIRAPDPMAVLEQIEVEVNKAITELKVKSEKRGITSGE